MHARAVTDRISIADQPDQRDLQGLKAEGFVGVINLRNDGEPEQPLSTSAEGEAVRALGLDYMHFGVGGQPFDPAGVKRVDDFLRHHPSGKVLIHCRKGGRAAAIALLHLARKEGWPAGEALARGDALGLKIEGGLRGLVEQFLTDHPPAER